jgi:N-acetyl-anhydromuramyl-L-alanine amidase AmpD
MDPGGYDAYRAECHFNPEQRMPTKPVSSQPTRYDTMRNNLPPELAEEVRTHGWTRERLAQWVDLFVLHYDVCGTSRRCFEVLQDRRGLSVHFMLDLDGTIYQTLDLKERAWHAGSANDRSVGVEIANMGAYPDMKVLDKWYGLDADGRVRVTFPEGFGEPGLRRADYVPRPARAEPVVGAIHGRELHQYDLTPAQYESLVKLTATLGRVLPKIRLEAPRDAAGHVRTNVLTPDELADFHGIVGHYHITTGKVDPGPAFDWERVLKGARRQW